MYLVVGNGEGGGRGGGGGRVVGRRSKISVLLGCLSQA